MLGIACGAFAQETNQKVFKTPDEAAAALVRALKGRDFAGLNDLIGFKVQTMVSGDKVLDKDDLATFLKLYAQMHRFANGPEWQVLSDSRGRELADAGAAGKE